MQGSSSPSRWQGHLSWPPFHLRASLACGLHPDTSMPLLHMQACWQPGSAPCGGPPHSPGKSRLRAPHPPWPPCLCLHPCSRPAPPWGPACPLFSLTHTPRAHLCLLLTCEASGQVPPNPGGLLCPQNLGQINIPPLNCCCSVILRKGCLDTPGLGVPGGLLCRPGM